MKIFLTMLLFCGIANATDPQGRKGFINSGAQSETFSASTPWKDIEKEVQGGPWVTP